MTDLIRRTMLAALLAGLVFGSAAHAADVRIGFVVKQPEEPCLQMR